MRIAVVDVGTNTTRLYIAEVEGGTLTGELTRESCVTRLGAGVDATGRLADEALAREHEVLAGYQRRIADARPDQAVAVMTSAVRDAANGLEFADEVTERYGLEVHVITGDEEARLTYLGATDQLDSPAATPPAATPPARTPASDEPSTLVFDIGGGSTELVLGRGRDVSFHVSTQAGVVRQADRHIRSDPPTGAELAAVAADVSSVLDAAVPQQLRAHPGRALGVAGTPTSLAAIAQKLERYDPARVHGYRLSATERDEIFTQLARLPLSERRRVPGLHPDRALAILPGIVILTEIMSLFALEEIEVSEHDILRGAALHYATH